LQTKSSYQILPLPWAFYFFLFLLFQVQALDHHGYHTIITIFTIAPSLGIVLPISWSIW
jgi:hypothetical protein